MLTIFLNIKEQFGIYFAINYVDNKHPLKISVSHARKNQTHREMGAESRGP